MGDTFERGDLRENGVPKLGTCRVRFRKVLGNSRCEYGLEGEL